MLKMPKPNFLQLMGRRIENEFHIVTMYHHAGHVCTQGCFLLLKLCVFGIKCLATGLKLDSHSGVDCGYVCTEFECSCYDIYPSCASLRDACSSFSCNRSVHCPSIGRPRCFNGDQDVHISGVYFSESPLCKHFVHQLYADSYDEDFSVNVLTSCDFDMLNSNPAILQLYGECSRALEQIAEIFRNYSYLVRYPNDSGSSRSSFTSDVLEDLSNLPCEDVVASCPLRHVIVPYATPPRYGLLPDIRRDTYINVLRVFQEHNNVHDTLVGFCPSN